MELAYRQRIGGTGNHGIDYTVDGLQYSVEYSEDLSVWIVSADSVTYSSIHATEDPDIAEVRVRSTTPLSAQPRHFLRLRITKIQSP